MAERVPSETRRVSRSSWDATESGEEAPAAPRFSAPPPPPPPPLPLARSPARPPRAVLLGQSFGVCDRQETGATLSNSSFREGCGGGGGGRGGGDLAEGARSKERRCTKKERTPELQGIGKEDAPRGIPAGIGKPGARPEP